MTYFDVGLNQARRVQLRRGDPPPGLNAFGRTSSPWATCAILVFSIAATFAALRFNPVGFTGGGTDDQRYFDIAGQWWAGGATPGTTHWALRHPLILSTLAAFKFGGHKLAALSLVPAFYAVFLSAMTTAMLARHAGARAAFLWLPLFLASPIMHALATRLFPEMMELALGAASLWLVWDAVERPRLRRAKLVAAGAFLGVAILTRETAGALLAVYGIAFLFRPVMPRATWLWIGAGLVPVVAADVVWLWLQTGDWLYRVHIGQRHVLIPSDHLTGKVYKGGGPILNFDLASKWVPSGPLPLHWTVDPVLNLILDPDFGQIFAGWALLSLPWFPRNADAAYARFRKPLLLLAAVTFVVVTWILVLRPQPRYYLFATYAATIAVAIRSAALTADERTRKGARRVLALMLLAGIMTIAFQRQADRPQRLILPFLARNEGVYFVAPDVAGRLRSPLAEAGLQGRVASGDPPIGGLRIRLLASDKPLRFHRPVPALSNYAVVRTIWESRPLIHRATEAPMATRRPAFIVERRIR